MSKKCADCGCEVNPNVIRGMYYCPRCDDDKTERDVLPPTLFDRITSSPEVLAESFVFISDSFNKPAELVNGSIVICNWQSLITGKFYLTKAEAIAATVAKLKEAKDE